MATVTGRLMITGFSFDDEYHMTTCVNCKQEIEKEAHVFDEETNTCTVCGAEILILYLN